MELGIPYLIAAILCDNMSTIGIAHNSVLLAGTKHMVMDLFSVRENVLNKQAT